MLLIYVRHGQPIYNPDSLTPLGTQQAVALAKRLELYGIDRIFSSTSNRAIQTAKPISELLGKEIISLEFCHEDYAGKKFCVKTENGEDSWSFLHQKTKELFAEKTVALNDKWYDDNRFLEYGFKEGIECVNAHVDEWLLDLGYRHNREKGLYEVIKPNNEHVALFAHGGFGQVFLSSILDIPYPTLSIHFDYLNNSAFTVIDFSEYNGVAIPKVTTYGNTEHLFSAKIPVTK